ncbi:OLC1v1006115C1 [Oldenlandia corymbosa var. corymbosa]|uniref:OLC1v1006115C1 n=1 Tax=Oldenlandia corymbosa var. corymbosa TaxID=529605 RepID=A0AAV1DHK0_OLDCO|nr:OLC1v1006115C1 [Oldenlandia corymbosa var. corymbosa]
MRDPTVQVTIFIRFPLISLMKVSFHMPGSFYEIPDVPPSEDMLEDPYYIPDLFVPNVSDYPPHHNVSPVSVFNGLSDSTDDSDSDGLISGMPAKVRTKSSSPDNFCSDSSDGSDCSKKSSISVYKNGRGVFKKRGIRRRFPAASAVSAPQQCQDHFAQTDSADEHFCMKARRAVSEADLPVSYQHSERNPSVNQHPAMKSTSRRKGGTGRTSTG